MFDQDIVPYLALKQTKGDFGIEIEMEMDRPLEETTDITKYWRFEIDNSLRGYSQELVVKSPINLDKVGPYITKLKDSISDQKVCILPSIRAGVHIHLNMQGYTVGDVIKFMLCYYPLETVLTNRCGFGRQGNLFCLRAKDAEFILSSLERVIQKEDLYILRHDKYRYTALNPTSLFKYGSLEFRALATTPELDNIERFCDILYKLRDYAKSLENVWENMNSISYAGPKEWLVKILGEDNVKFLDYPGMEYDIVSDARDVQLCYHSYKKFAEGK